MAKNTKNPVKVLEEADLSLFTKDEIKALEVQAADIVATERKEQATKAFLKKATDAERRKHDPSEALEEITLNLAEHSAFLRIDDRYYFHNHTYTVPHSVARGMREMEARGWKHQEEIEGKKSRPYQRLRNIALGRPTVQ